MAYLGEYNATSNLLDQDREDGDVAVLQVLSEQTINIVDLVLCTLSILGALAMILPFCLSPAMRKVRHRLILGLAVTDFLEALAVLIPTSRALQGRNFSPGSPGCRITGIIYYTCVLGNGLWAISIALATYTLLTQSMSRAARLIHRYRFYVILWITIWGLGLVNAMIGYALYDFEEVAGFCVLKDPGLFGKLDLFIPRAVTTVVVIAIYIRLFVFFRWSDNKIEKSLTAASRALERSVESPNAPIWLSRQLSRIQTNQESGASEHDASSSLKLERKSTFTLESQSSYNTTRRSSEITLIARNGARSDKPPQTRVTPPDLVAWDTTLWEKKGNQEKDLEGDKLPSLVKPALSPKTSTFGDVSVTSAPSFSRQSSTDGPNEMISRSRSMSGTLAPIPSSDDLPHVPSSANLLPCESQQSYRSSLRSTSIDAQFQAMSQSMRKNSSMNSSIDSSIAEDGRTSRLPSFRDMLQSEEAGESTSTSAPAPRRLSGAELNKKASLLMLLYPAVYVLLFSMSLARVIVDLTGEADNPAPFNGILHAASRFMILSNGTCDAIIYVLIEWSFRRSASR